MMIPLSGGYLDKLVEFEFAGCVAVAVERLICADFLVDIHAEDEAVSDV
jgi:hypothetical protein